MRCRVILDSASIGAGEVGLGSGALHASLDAVAQAGDELPMLYASALAAFLLLLAALGRHNAGLLLCGHVPHQGRHEIHGAALDHSLHHLCKHLVATRFFRFSWHICEVCWIQRRLWHFRGYLCCLHLHPGGLLQCGSSKRREQLLSRLGSYCLQWVSAISDPSVEAPIRYQVIRPLSFGLGASLAMGGICWALEMGMCSAVVNCPWAALF